MGRPDQNKRNYRTEQHRLRRLPRIVVGLVGVVSFSSFWGVEGAISSAIARDIARDIASERNYIRPSSSCPETVEAIMPPLLRDLPSYANRAIQRSRRRERTYVPPGYVLIAGNPEFTPLSLGVEEFTPTISDNEIRQVFFTTLERRYVQNSLVRQQNYHWIFLTETSEGWQLAFMFSRSGGYFTIPQPPSPPEDTSQGAIAQGIRAWLRDCQAGDILPLAD